MTRGMGEPGKKVFEHEFKCMEKVFEDDGDLRERGMISLYTGHTDPVHLCARTVGHSISAKPLGLDLYDATIPYDLHLHKDTAKAQTLAVSIHLALKTF